MMRVNKQSEALLILMRDGYEPFENVVDSRNVNGWSDLHASGLVRRMGITSAEITDDGHLYLRRIESGSK